MLTMKWIHNVTAFAPSNPYLVDKEETTWDEIPKIHKNGQDYVYVSVKDNTMYDRYMKGDLVIIKLNANPETSVVGDALVLLPDESVCLKQIKFGAKKVKLTDRNELDPKSVSYPKSKVKCLGVPTSVIRA